MKNKKNLILFLFLFLTAAAYGANITGDVNSDGSVNIIDALVVSQFYIGLEPPINTAAADVDCSGRIDVIDALMIAQYYVGLITNFPCSPTPEPTPPVSVVEVRGRQIYLNGNPFYMKGVCWNPVAAGNVHPDGVDYPGFVEQDAALMQQAGINTIRSYEQLTDRAVLDKLYSRGIFVINTVFCNVKYDNSHVLNAVNAVKDHPAILMWAIGNEWNYNGLYGYETGQPQTFDQSLARLNQVAALIKAADPAHPIATVYGAVSGVDPEQWVIDAMPDVDVWGFNMYSGLNFSNLFSEWHAKSSKPLFLAEYGADAWNANTGGVDETAQADATRILTQLLIDNSSAADPNRVCAGGTIFEWADEWWKAGNPSSHDPGGVAPGGGPYPDGTFNEEYWGVVDVYRKVRPAYFELQKLFTP